mgnify:CR=1 FL=1
MQNTEYVLQCIHYLFDTYSSSYREDHAHEQDHVLLFSDGLIWLRPNAQDTTDEEMQPMSIYMTHNINFIEDDSNMLMQAGKDEYNTNSYSRQLADIILGMDEVKLLSESSFINVIHNNELDVYGFAKTNQDFQPIISVVGVYFISERNQKLEDAWDEAVQHIEHQT